MVQAKRSKSPVPAKPGKNKPGKPIPPAPQKRLKARGVAKPAEDAESESTTTRSTGSRPGTTARQRIHNAIERLVAAIPNAEVRPPPSEQAVAKLVGVVGPLAPEMRDYFHCCDGVRLPEGSRLYSVEEMLQWDIPQCFPISDNRCGDFDLVTSGTTLSPGAVVFWEHEECAVETVSASSLSVYVELWVLSCVAEAQGKEGPRPTAVTWPPSVAALKAFEKRMLAFCRKYDPALLPLVESEAFLEQLAGVSVRPRRRGKR